MSVGVPRSASIWVKQHGAESDPRARAASSSRMTGSNDDYSRRILDLLEARGAHKTICPSELLTSDDKNNPALMERVRESARRLASRHLIEFTQRGRVIDPVTAKGPIRLRLKR